VREVRLDRTRLVPYSEPYTISALKQEAPVFSGFLAHCGGRGSATVVAVAGTAGLSNGGVEREIARTPP